MITSYYTQDTIKPKLVITINPGRLIPDSVFQKLDQVPEHIKQAELAARKRKAFAFNEVIITDTTSVCSRNSIADATFYDSLAFIRNIDQLPPVFYPYQDAEKSIPERQEFRVAVINNLKEGRELPERPFQHDWMIAIIFIAAYLWLIVRSTTRSIFPEMTRFILFRGINDPASCDTGSIFTWQSTILNFISFVVIGLFAFCAASWYEFIPTGFSPFLFMLISLGAVILAITSRHFICLATGNLTGESEVFNEYLINVYQSYRFSSVIIFAVVILLAYSVIFPSGFLFIAGTIVLIIFYLLRVLRLFLIFIKRNISVLYLILYLCALEILPAMILVKYFTGLDL